MLPAHNRMRTPEDYRATIRGGARARSHSLMLHFWSPETADTADRASALVGFVVPKTVGNAVDRNRLRRQLRHLMRDRIKQLSPSEAIVIRVFPQARRKTSVQLGDDLDRALCKVIDTGR